MVVRGLGRAFLRLCLSVTAEIAHGDGGGISSGHALYACLLSFSFFALVVYYKPTVPPKAPMKGVRTTWQHPAVEKQLGIPRTVGATTEKSVEFCVFRVVSRLFGCPIVDFRS